MALPDGVEITHEIGNYQADSHVDIRMPVLETLQLVHWLDSTNTSTMNDHEFLFFAEFKRRLQEAAKNADA
jgi:hypothetical protein